MPRLGPILPAGIDPPLRSQSVLVRTLLLSRRFFTTRSMRGRPPGGLVRSALVYLPGEHISP